MSLIAHRGVEGGGSHKINNRGRAPHCTGQRRTAAPRRTLVLSQQQLLALSQPQLLQGWGAGALQRGSARHGLSRAAELRRQPGALRKCGARPPRRRLLPPSCCILTSVHLNMG